MFSTKTFNIFKKGFNKISKPSTPSHTKIQEDDPKWKGEELTFVMFKVTSKVSVVDESNFASAEALRYFLSGDFDANGNMFEIEPLGL